MENSIYLKCIPLVFEDHGNKLLKALYDQQKKSQLCDVSLVVENISFPAHKAVLAAHSSYFQALFDRGKLTDDAGSKACNVTTIHLSSITAETFIPILHFLYTSRLHVFLENVRDLMRTARKLQISTIVQACERLIAENVTLPSVCDVKKHQTADMGTSCTQEPQSVLYVDLKSEDDEDSFNPTQNQQQNALMLSSSADSGDLSEPTIPLVSSYTVDTTNASKTRIGRTQKKQGFPKKIQQMLPPSGQSPPSTLPCTLHNIATISPTSIFGRTTTSQASRSRSIGVAPSTSQTIENISEKSATSGHSSGFDPFQFENHLETLGNIFAGDPVMVDSYQSVDSSVSSPMLVEKSPPSVKVSQSKLSDSLQVQSVFSMSPKLSNNKTSLVQSSTVPTSIPKIVNAMFSNEPSVVSCASTIPTHSGGNTPSVYTCKECCKYFTNIAEAVQHYYTEHQQQKKYSRSSSMNVVNRNSHSCPHCGRLFNNKNNLKRHILIKHTTDKRFKCAICGRRYAIRQSLQYHIRSIHGKEYGDDINTSSINLDDETVHSTASDITLSSPPPKSSLVPSLHDSVQSSEFSFGDLSNVVSSTESGSLLVADKDQMMIDTTTTSNLPTIKRIESIRNVQTINKSGTPSDNDCMDDAEGNSDSHLVKLEPRQAPNSSPCTSAFPGSSTSSISLSSPVHNVSGVVLTQTLSNIGQDLNHGGNPFVLAGSSNLPTILPAFGGEYRRQTTEIPSSTQNRMMPRLYRCDTCDRAFTTVQAYTRHRRSCNKHECPICHRGFSQMGNMRRHIKIFHSDQKPYECKVCNKAYGIQQSFRYHMRDKHGITTISKVEEKGKKN